MDLVDCAHRTVVVENAPSYYEQDVIDMLSRIADPDETCIVAISSAERTSIEALSGPPPPAGTPDTDNRIFALFSSESETECVIRSFNGVVFGGRRLVLWRADATLDDPRKTPRLRRLNTESPVNYPSLIRAAAQPTGDAALLLLTGGAGGVSSNQPLLITTQKGESQGADDDRKKQSRADLLAALNKIEKAAEASTEESKDLFMADHLRMQCIALTKILRKKNSILKQEIKELESKVKNQEKK